MIYFHLMIDAIYFDNISSNDHYRRCSVDTIFLWLLSIFASSNVHIECIGALTAYLLTQVSENLFDELTASTFRLAQNSLIRTNSRSVRHMFSICQTTPGVNTVPISSIQLFSIFFSVCFSCPCLFSCHQPPPIIKMVNILYFPLFLDYAAREMNERTSSKRTMMMMINHGGQYNDFCRIRINFELVSRSACVHSANHTRYTDGKRSRLTLTYYFIVDFSGGCFRKCKISHHRRAIVTGCHTLSCSACIFLFTFVPLSFLSLFYLIFIRCTLDFHDRNIN